jgi:hypothetical protein
MNVEARVLINGQVHQVRHFVYYFPECRLVLKRRAFQGEAVADLRRLEFQLELGPADWRSIRIDEVTWE